MLQQRHRAKKDAEPPVVVCRPAEFERRSWLLDLEGEVDLAVGRHGRRQLDVPLRIAVSELAGSDALAVHQRLDSERRIGPDANAAERELEDVVALADLLERERELGTRTLRPDTRFVRIGPPVSEPAVVAQVGQFERLTDGDMKATLIHLATSSPVKDPSLTRKPRNRRVIVGRQQRHRAKEKPDPPVVVRPTSRVRAASVAPRSRWRGRPRHRRTDAQAARCATPDRRI